MALRKIYLATVVFCLLISISSCQKIRSLWAGPAQNRVVKRSDTVRFTGYYQTVTVNSSPMEVLEFLADPNKLGLRMIEFVDSDKTIFTEGKMSEPGDNAPVRMKTSGLSIKGRMIVLSAGQEHMLITVESPFGLVIQRWRMQPIEQGIKVSLKMEYEIPSQGLMGMLDRFYDFREIMKLVLKDLDYFLARLQAHFDPSLDPDQLVAMGLRGETYDALWQVHEASIWIDAPAKQMQRKVLEPDYIAGALSTMKVDGLEACLTDPGNRTRWEQDQGVPISCPATITLGETEWALNNLVMLSPHNARNLLVSYGTFADGIYRAQFSGRPENGGTRLRIVIAVEPPRPDLSRYMEAMVAVNELPLYLEDTLLDLKARTEGKDVLYLPAVNQAANK